MPHVLLLVVACAAPPGDPDRGDKPPGSPTPPNVAATVNGEVIRLDQVDAAVRRRPTDAPLTAAQARRLRMAATDDLIDDLLVRQYLKQHAPPVDPAELDKHLHALAASLQKGGKTLADLLKETGQSEAQVRETWAGLIQFQKYADARGTEAELRKYHEANRDLFDGTEVRAAHVVVRVGPAAPPGQWAAARTKLAAVRADVLAGKLTFADAARKYSECPSAAKGGDLGFIGRRDPAVDEAFARTAFALKAGGVSDPTDTDLGVHLIAVGGRKPGTPAAFEAVADLVRECFADDLRRQLVAHLRKRAAVQVTVP